MEHPQKRPRLSNPVDFGDSIAYNSDDYAGPEADEINGLELDDVQGEEEEEEEEDYAEEDAEQVDPDEQLERTRALLDLKLKSKFEAIFEKYGRDFTGIGDEIDLRTGEIVVDNGHLFEMQDERDDGTTKPSLLEAFTQNPNERFDSLELDKDEADEVHDSHIKLDDMEEDDMILFQNTSVLPGKPETPPSRRSLPKDSQFDELEREKTTATPKVSLPSEHEILAQFGQDIGPKIAKYVAQQRVQDDSAIEPAWRTPGLPLATPGKRPILKSILLQPESDRSPSPKGATSVWAPKKPRGRPRRDGANTGAIFRGETIIHDRTWFSSGYVSTTVTKQHTERVSQSRPQRTMSVPLNEMLNTGESNLRRSSWAKPKGGKSNHVYELSEASDEEPDSSEEKLAQSYKPRRSWSKSNFLPKRITANISGRQPSPVRHTGKANPSPKRKRKRGTFVRYTKADDEALQEWVDDILKQGILLWSRTHWHLLAEKQPRHSYLGWKDRYRRLLYSKDANPSTKEDGTKRKLGAGGDISQTALRPGNNSESERDDYSTSNEHSHEVLQEGPAAMSIVAPRIILSRSDMNDDSELNSIDLETLDPALHPPSAKDVTKTKGPHNLLQQQLTSLPSTIDLYRESDAHSNTFHDTETINGPRSSSTQTRMDSNLGNHSALTQEGNYGTAVFGDRVHEITTHNNNKASVILQCATRLSTDGDMPLNSRIVSKEDRPQQPKNQETLDTSYGFSDEEDEVELANPRRLPQVQDRYSKRQIIDLTGEGSTPANKVTLNPKSPSRFSRKRNQSPISVSSSSYASDIDESEEVSFFLEPTPPIAESPMTLSDILGPDDLVEMRKKSSSVLKRGVSQENKRSTVAGRGGRDLSDNARPTAAGNQVSKKMTPKSLSRANVLGRNTEASPAGSAIETPGGTKKRCGENGFSCGKGFCFKCLEG